MVDHESIFSVDEDGDALPDLVSPLKSPTGSRGSDSPRSRGERGSLRGFPQLPVVEQKISRRAEEWSRMSKNEICEEASTKRMRGRQRWMVHIAASCIADSQGGTTDSPRATEDSGPAVPDDADGHASRRRLRTHAALPRATPLPRLPFLTCGQPELLIHLY